MCGLGWLWGCVFETLASGVFPLAVGLTRRSVSYPLTSGLM